MTEHTWNLFIDDERWPSDVTWAEWYSRLDDWAVARNAVEVEELISSLGMPTVISFDHDLGPEGVEPSGKQIADMIIDKVMDGVWEIPENFLFYVHSQNPVGKANIQGLLDNFLKRREQ